MTTTGKSTDRNTGGMLPAAGHSGGRRPAGRGQSYQRSAGKSDGEYTGGTHRRHSGESTELCIRQQFVFIFQGRRRCIQRHGRPNSIPVQVVMPTFEGGIYRMTAKNRMARRSRSAHIQSEQRPEGVSFHRGPINYTHMTELELKGGYGEHGRSCFLLKQENGRSLMFDCGSWIPMPFRYPNITRTRPGKSLPVFVPRPQGSHGCGAIPAPTGLSGRHRGQPGDHPPYRPAL